MEPEVKSVTISDGHRRIPCHLICPVRRGSKEANLAFLSSTGSSHSSSSSRVRGRRRKKRRKGEGEEKEEGRRRRRKDVGVGRTLSVCIVNRLACASKISPCLYFGF